MRPQTIAISNQKGGTGKTALTFEIGTILSKHSRVLFVDLDGQGDLTRLLAAGKHETGALEVLTGSTTARDALINISAKAALMPATEALLNADTVLINQGGNIAGRLRKALTRLKDFDYIIIDTPPKLGTLTTNAINAADLVYIPALAESNSIDGVLNFLRTFTAINRDRETPATIAGIVVMRYTAQSLINRQMMESIEDIAQQIGTAVFPVKETVKLREAHFFQKSITDYAPKTDTAGQILELVKQLEKDGKKAPKKA